jgi:hypothetical protein
LEHEEEPMTERTHVSRMRTWASIAGVTAAAVLLAACGATDDDGAAAASDTADGEVASIGTVAGASTGDAGGDDTGSSGSDDQPDEADVQQATLDFAQCMREHGVDMPDPTFDAEGNGQIMVRAGGPGDEIDPEQMEAANEACQPIMEAVRGAFDAPDPEELERMKAEALEFSQCMREHGVDIPDPQFSEDGAMTVAVGGGRLGEAGEGPDAIDADAFNEAAEACGGPGGGMLAVNSPEDSGAVLDIDDGSDG